MNRPRWLLAVGTGAMAVLLCACAARVPPPPAPAAPDARRAVVDAGAKSLAGAVARADSLRAAATAASITAAQLAGAAVRAAALDNVEAAREARADADAAAAVEVALTRAAAKAEQSAQEAQTAQAAQAKALAKDEAAAHAEELRSATAAAALRTWSLVGGILVVAGGVLALVFGYLQRPRLAAAAGLGGVVLGPVCALYGASVAPLTSVAPYALAVLALGSVGGAAVYLAHRHHQVTKAS